MLLPGVPSLLVCLPASIDYYILYSRNWTGFLNLVYTRSSALQSLDLHPVFRRAVFPMLPQGDSPLAWFRTALYYPVIFHHNQNYYITLLVSYIVPYIFIRVRVPRCITLLPHFILWLFLKLAIRCHHPTGQNRLTYLCL